MTAKRLTFHISHNTTPEAVKTVLTFCRDGRVTFDHLARELGRKVETVQHIIPLLRQLGLVEPNQLALTDTGIAFHHLNEQTSSFLPEAVHHVLYTTHVFDKGRRLSWAYAEVVDALWASGSVLLDVKAKAQLVGKVVQEAEQAFGVPVEQIAFSTNSINGVLNWLRALDPPTVTNTRKQNSFSRRYFCAPIIFLWAVDFLYRAEEKPHGIRIFLTPERIERLCKLCVLDPSGLDNVLMLAKKTSDYDHGGFFDYGTEGGFGRWILLVRPCPVPTLPGEVKC
jgi:hypothetical protein